MQLLGLSSLLTTAALAHFAFAHSESASSSLHARTPPGSVRSGAIDPALRHYTPQQIKEQHEHAALIAKQRHLGHGMAQPRRDYGNARRAAILKRDAEAALDADYDALAERDAFADPEAFAEADALAEAEADWAFE